jgi:hypothetical protein
MSLHRGKLKEVGLNEWLIVVATAVMAGSTVLYTVYARKQLGTMQNTLALMRQSGQQTTDQVNQMIGNLNWLAKGMDGSVQQTVAAMQASQKQAIGALNASIAASRLDQRAWICQTAVLPPVFRDGNRSVYLKDGEQTSLSTGIVNSGKTPARNVMQENSYRTLPFGVAFSPRYPGGGSRRVGVILPGVPFQLATPVTERVTSAQVNTYVTGANVLYLYGRISYDDIFGQAHETTYCMYLLRDLTAFTDCDTYNEAN